MTFSTKCDIIYTEVKNMFLKTKETVPSGVGFATFDITHLLWLLFSLSAIVIATIIYRKSNTKNRNIMRIVLGIVIVLNEIIKNIVAFAIGDFGIGHFPFHLCGINILLIAFDLIKQTKIVRNFLYYIGIPGATLALLFPNWTALPCMNFFHIHSFTIHALLVMYPVILVTRGDIKPTIKDMPKCVALLIGMAIPIYFINLIFDTNFMFLMNPETGNPLGLFEKYLGSHLFGFPILLPIVMFIMYMPDFIMNKISAKKTSVQTDKKEYELTTK